MNRKLFLNQEKSLLIIPRTAGVYYFYDKSNNLLYVGVAKILRSRVWKHFVQRKFRKIGTQVIDKVFDRVYWIEIEETSHWYAYKREAYLIDKLQPILNSESGRDIYYNFRDAEFTKEGVMDSSGWYEIDNFFKLTI